MKLRAPFPWFGGKSRAASLIWEGLGDVPNYVEPFAGSLAVLLGRPTAPRTETVNDLDCYVANFWRALARDPEAVAEHADWPVNEADLHARHRWLVAQEGFRERMRREPDFFDAKVAGWWVWGLSAWIGGGFCSGASAEHNKLPDGGSSWSKHTSRRGVVAISERKPHLGAPGQGTGMRGVHRSSLEDRAPHKLMLSGNGHGVGVHSNRRHALVSEFQVLAERLRGVRVCCGDWTRVLAPSVTTGHGLTAVVLDPPYAQAERAATIYGCETEVSAAVREWAVANGTNPHLRIALCGYEGEHEMPSDWRLVEWKASGGYGHREDNENRFRERIWFSPACMGARQGGLFA